jgi:hypothetical protein
MDPLGELEIGKRRKAVIYWGVAAGVSVVLRAVVFSDRDLWSNEAYAFWSIVLAWVLPTIAMVKGCKLRTPKGGITHWKRVGLFGLILWGSVIASLPVFGITFAIDSGVPSLIWFPIWTGVNAIRGVRHPERLTPMRFKKKPSQ